MSKKKDRDEDCFLRVEDERESAELETSQYQYFDPQAPCEEFSFADVDKVEKSKLEDYFKVLKSKGVAGWLMSALTRGIGIHHAGMNRKYRQT